MTPYAASDKQAWLIVDELLDAGSWTLSGGNQVPFVPTPTEIGPGENLNNWTTTGLYTQSQNADTASPATQYPVPLAGQLEVTTAPDGNMCWQRYTVYNAGTGGDITYQRTRYNGTWSSWAVLGTINIPDPVDTYVASDQSITSTTRQTETPTAVRATMANPSQSRRLLCRGTVQLWLDSNGNPSSATAFYLDMISISGSPQTAVPAIAWRIDCPSGQKTYLSGVAENTFWVPAGGTVVMGVGASRSGTGMSPLIRYVHTSIIPERYEG
jgi:hypothetical protein